MAHITGVLPLAKGGASHIHTKLHQSKNWDTLMNHEKLVMTLFKSRVNAFE
jgi:hypothetical protein